ncbi:MAG: hypothetical protein GEU90_13675 [Gemmatimonas sp.]|nr:hypothetical protein [Gemmatimonas sp.]
MKPAAAGFALVLLWGGCALLPESEPEPRDRRDVEEFTTDIREALTDHEWQTVLSNSDPAHYQAQVVDLEIEEPQYIAELFDLHRADNTIQEGDTLDWPDLDRIQNVDLAPTDTVGPPFGLTGSARLESGEELELRATVTEVRGRLVLTGAVG